MRPNTLQEINELTSQINDSLAKYGEAFIELSGHEEYFYEVYCLKPERMKVVEDKFVYSVAGRTVEMDNILHIKAPKER